MDIKKIAIIGAGGWGTALATILSAEFNVTIWAIDRETADEINLNHTNSDFLPNVDLPDNILATSDINSLADSDIIVNTVPTQYIRQVYSRVDFPFDNKIIVNGSKGIEQNTLFRISEIFAEVTEISADKYVVLSGPSHAEEVARNIPTTILVASTNMELAKAIRDVFSTKHFRLYSSDDVTGCEIGGALKNVIAITAGMLDGVNLGDNTKAALITRGLAEISRLGIKMGANPMTFSGLSGLGDLIVTCQSQHSRNRKVGELLGQGRKLKSIIEEYKTVAEGVNTTVSAFQMAKKMKVEMPIVEQTHKVLFEDISVNDAIDNLMSRIYKNEVW